MQSLRISILFSCLLSGLALYAQEDVFSIGTEHQIHSEILNEDRSYIVQLPASYEADALYLNKHYPVAILLDGGRLFHLSSGMIQTLAAPGVEEIPEMILVAVRNTNRNRDFLPTESMLSSSGERLDQLAESGGAGAFHAFLSEELLPHIDSTYRTQPFRLLIGHSFAGLFAAYSMLEHVTFDAFLAIDPSLWWDDVWIVDRLAQNPPDRFFRFYLAQASNPFNPGADVSRSGQAIQAFKATMMQNQSFNFGYRYFPDEDHFSVPLAAIPNGLKMIFGDYRMPLSNLSKQDARSIQNYYRRLSQNMGYEVLPPGYLFNQIGMFWLSDTLTQAKAIALLELNQRNYPNSYIPHLSLGQAYERLGRTQESIDSYQNVLQISPQNQTASNAIERLARP
ncbi:MAG: alpha/beta hydrolase-fold protein [Bacteroidota bacterium]